MASVSYLGELVQTPVQRGLFAPGLPPAGADGLPSPDAGQMRAQYQASKVLPSSELESQDGAGNGDQKEGNRRGRTEEILSDTLPEDTPRPEVVDDSEVIPPTQPHPEDVLEREYEGERSDPPAISGDVPQPPSPVHTVPPTPAHTVPPTPASVVPVTPKRTPKPKAKSIYDDGVYWKRLVSIIL